MAWGARNLISTQVQSALPRRLPLREGLFSGGDAGDARRGLLPGPRRARGRAGRGEGAELCGGRLLNVFCVFFGNQGPTSR